MSPWGLLRTPPSPALLLNDGHRGLFTAVLDESLAGDVDHVNEAIAERWRVGFYLSPLLLFTAEG